jgi:DNA-binding response OmpR family regulator
MQILLVEDDRRLARQLKKGLEENGHVVHAEFDGMNGLEAACQGGFDVLVLDVMLPGMDGCALVRQLRRGGSKTPVLMLTGRDSAEDIVTGLDAGADDYLTKPFAFKVLLARLRALGRRKEVEPKTCLQVADLVLDPADHSVHRGKTQVFPTPREFILLETLMRKPGRVFTRSRLIEAVWGNEREVEGNTLDVFVKLLRSKIEPRGTSKLIQTIRGIGYVMREEEHL